MVTLDTIEKLAQAHQLTPSDYILPIDSALEQWPIISLSDAGYLLYSARQPIITPQAPASGWVRLLRINGEFLGVVKF